MQTTIKGKPVRRLAPLLTLAVATAIGTLPAFADIKDAEKWVDSEFKPSTLSRQQQLDELKWFIDAAAKLKAKGVNEIHVVSETIDTHVYEIEDACQGIPRSPASPSNTTSFKRVTWWRRFKPRCNREKAFTTAGSMTAI
jgi:hypothetical protein